MPQVARISLLMPQVAPTSLPTAQVALIGLPIRVRLLAHPTAATLPRDPTRELMIKPPNSRRRQPTNDRFRWQAMDPIPTPSPNLGLGVMMSFSIFLWNSLALS